MARQDGSLGAIPVAFEADSITLQNNGTLLNEADGNALSIHQNRGITLGTGGGAFVAGFNQPLTVNSVISGSAGNTITILGNNGTVFFTADNTYLGNTILGPVTASGTARLTIGNGGISGSLGAGNVTNDGQLTFNRSDAHSYNGDISGTGTLIKQGAGTLTLGGTSTYTGTTTISAGTLLINGSLGNTTVSIADAARLGGSDGSITGSVTTAAAGSIIAPGNSPGTLTLGALNVTAGATFEYELGTNSDLLEITGALTGGGTLTFNFFDSGDIAALTPYTLFTFGSQTGLDYADLVANTFPGNFILDTNFGTGGWQINSGNLQVQFIPEPSSALLAPLGLLLAARRRRQR
jgi:fibronectin-binding autotransporter adhesin